MSQKPSPLLKTNTVIAKTVVTPRSFWQDDFPILRKASLLLGVTLALAILMILGSRVFLVQQEVKQVQAETERSQAQGKYQSINNEKNDIRLFQPKYIRVSELGFVGEEKRLDIVEQVRFIQETRRLLPISYEISPQQVVTLDPALNTGEFELRSSRIQVRMGLMHELDILHFLADLRSKAYFIPQSCSIAIVDVNKALSLSARLQSECRLNWVSMGRRVAVEAMPQAVNVQ